MSVNTRIIRASPEQVWSVLADGWTYPLWVVGASRVRAVDQGWPANGARIHHSVGVWPALIDDYTEVLDVEPGQSIRMRARGWPMGEAEVVIELSTSGVHTHASIRERVVSGPGLFVPEPLKDASLRWRNTETLRRMAYVAENRPNS